MATATATPAPITSPHDIIENDSPLAASTKFGIFRFRHVDLVVGADVTVKGTDNLTNWTRVQPYGSYYCELLLLQTISVINRSAKTNNYCLLCLFQMDWTGQLLTLSVIDKLANRLLLTISVIDKPANRLLLTISVIRQTSQQTATDYQCYRQI